MSMPGERWTVEALKEYLDVQFQRIESLLKAHEDRDLERFEAQNRALDTQVRTTEARLQGMNELRATMSDQASLFLGRSEYEAKHSELAHRIEDSVARLDARISSVDSRLTTAEGQQAGWTAARVAAFAAVAVLTGVIGAVVGVVLAVR